MVVVCLSDLSLESVLAWLFVHVYYLFNRSAHSADPRSVTPYPLSIALANELMFCNPMESKEFYMSLCSLALILMLVGTIGDLPRGLRALHGSPQGPFDNIL